MLMRNFELSLPRNNRRQPRMVGNHEQLKMKYADQHEARCSQFGATYSMTNSEHNIFEVLEIIADLNIAFVANILTTAHNADSVS